MATSSTPLAPCAFNSMIITCTGAYTCSSASKCSSASITVHVFQRKHHCARLPVQAKNTIARYVTRLLCSERGLKALSRAKHLKRLNLHHARRGTHSAGFSSRQAEPNNISRLYSCWRDRMRRHALTGAACTSCRDRVHADLSWSGPPKTPCSVQKLRVNIKILLLRTYIALYNVYRPP